MLLQFVPLLLQVTFGRAAAAGTARSGNHTVADARVQADALLGGRTGHVQQRAILFAHDAAAAGAAVGHVVVVFVAH